MPLELDAPGLGAPPGSFPPPSRLCVAVGSADVGDEDELLLLLEELELDVLELVEPELVLVEEPEELPLLELLLLFD